MRGGGAKVTWLDHSVNVRNVPGIPLPGGCESPHPINSNSVAQVYIRMVAPMGHHPCSGALSQLRVDSPPPVLPPLSPLPPGVHRGDSAREQPEAD